MNIYQAITGAMADVEPIAKGRVNKEQRFNFRGIDEIMNELQPVLKKHGLFVVPKVVDVIRQEKPTKSGGVLLYSIVTMEYTMYSQDGSSITGSTVGEGMDSGDKASNKAMAVALKYFLLQTFCIPTEDAKDPDAESPVVVQTKPAGKNHFNSVANALLDYLETGIFEHPENVEKVIANKNLAGMEKALAVAKEKEAHK